MQLFDIKTYLSNDILTKVDRASMINSLEVRVPILDHELVELAFMIPSNLKIYNTNKKYILKETFKELLPNRIISHKKMGFSLPLEKWFKDDYKDYVFENLVNNSHLENYFKKNQVRNIIASHYKGMRDYSSKIWSLLFLNEWLKQNE